MAQPDGGLPRRRRRVELDPDEEEDDMPTPPPPLRGAGGDTPPRDSPPRGHEDSDVSRATLVCFHGFAEAMFV
jgi:hypothetical protein